MKNFLLGAGVILLLLYCSPNIWAQNKKLIDVVVCGRNTGINVYDDGSMEVFKAIKSDIDPILDSISPKDPIIWDKYSKYINPYIEPQTCVKLDDNFLYLDAEAFYINDTTKVVYPILDTTTGIYSKAYSGFGYVSKGMIRDKSNEIIENGDSIIINRTAMEGAIMVPVSDSLVYLFTNGTGLIGSGQLSHVLEDATYILNPRIYYHIIKRKHNGAYYVTEKNKVLLDIDVNEPLTAVLHANGKDWWLIAHERNNSNNFLKWIISSDTIRFVERQGIGRVYGWNIKIDTTTAIPQERYWNIINSSRLQFMSQCFFSLDGNTLISKTFNPFSFGDSLDKLTDIFDIFSFDRCSGLLRGPARNRAYAPACYVVMGNNSDYIFVYSRQYFWKKDSVFDTYTIEEDRERFFTLFQRFYATHAVHLANGKILIGNNYSYSSSKIPDSLSFSLRVIPMNKDSLLYYPIIENPNGVGKAINLKPRGIGIDYWGKNQLPSIPLPKRVNKLLGPEPPKYEQDTFRLCRSKRRLYFRDALLDTVNYRAEWSPGGGLSDSTSFAPLIWAQDTTHYRLRIFTRKYGCEKINRDIFIELLPDSVKECEGAYIEPVADIRPDVQIYPNPVKNILTISSNKKILFVSFYDMSGKKVVQREPEDLSYQYDFDVKDITKGSYLCYIKTEGGIVTQRVVIE